MLFNYIFFSQMRCKGIISSTHRLSRKIFIRDLTSLRLLDNNFETIVLFHLAS